MSEPMVYISCDADRLAGISEAAKTARGIVGADDYTKIDVVRFLEFEIQKYIEAFQLIIEEDRLFSTEIMAAAKCDPPEIIIRESVYIDALNDGCAARFILAHELGHLWLRHGEAAASDSNLLNFSTATDGVVDFRHFEWEANEFASEFLMPSSFIAQLSASDAAVNYGVSFPFARKRLAILQKRNIKKTDSERRRAFAEEWRKRVFREFTGCVDRSNPVALEKFRIYEPYENLKFLELDGLTYSAVKRRM